MRSIWAGLFVVLVALVAGFLPQQFLQLHALSAHPAPAAVLGVDADQAPDAILCAAPLAPLSGTTRVGAGFSVDAPSAGGLAPAGRIAAPAAVRSGHRVDGLSLPLLR